MSGIRRHAARGSALLAGLLAGMIVADRFLAESPAPAASTEAPADAEVLRAGEAPWDAALGTPPRFLDVTAAAGIDFRHENGLTGEYKYPEIMGAGVCLFDYDGDGFLDIYLVNGNRLFEPLPDITNKLFHNQGDGTFTDATRRAGVGDAGFGQGATAADYDGDGDLDLYVSNFGPNVLYRNDGDGTFTDVTSEAAVVDPGWGQSCCFLDCNGDGRLDLYVQNYLTFSLASKNESYIYVGDEKVLDYQTPLGFQGSPDHLYRNNGDGTFTDVTREAGMFRPDGKGMGCACFDYDDDGHTDIFIANDSYENFLFRNRGNGTFEEIGLRAGVAYDGEGHLEASMGVDIGDHDGDGRLDLIVPCLRREVYTLYRNMGEYFEDASDAAGLSQPTSLGTGFNANFLDFDNDGDLDLFFANGGVRRNELAPADATYEEAYGISDLLLANDGKGRYVDVSARAGPYFREKLIGRGSASGDLDNDGDIDLVVSNLAGRAVVLRNETGGGNWVTLALAGRGVNRDALGSSVWIEAGGRRQRALVHGAVTYLSQSDRRVHFGLGDAERVDRLEVLWPNRTRQVFTNLPVNRFFIIEEGRDTVR